MRTKIEVEDLRFTWGLIRAQIEMECFRIAIRQQQNTPKHESGQHSNFYGLPPRFNVDFEGAELF